MNIYGIFNIYISYILITKYLYFLYLNIYISYTLITKYLYFLYLNIYISYI
jgi:hypothetical protein